MSERLFVSFNRDSRPLSTYLRDKYAGALGRRIVSMTIDDLAGDPSVLARALAAEVSVQAPVLGGTELVAEGNGSPRPGREPGVRHMTFRYLLAIQVDGDAELLMHWPDLAGGSLDPVDIFDGDPWADREPNAPYDYDDEIRRHEWKLASDRWILAKREGNGQWAVFTRVELTAEDRDKVARGDLDVRALVDQQRAQIEPIVAAIATQTRGFFQGELPKTVSEFIDTHRRQLEVSSAVRANLVWPDGWKYPEPTVVESQDAQPSAEPADVGTGNRDIAYEVRRPRLSSATFDDVMRTMRVWADAVERHPAAYADLVEDRISDLLAATLNAALPGAHREVYSRGGKSDIYIRADVLNDGAGPTKVFICECKWWKGQAKVEPALDQLFGYLNVTDTACVLLFFVPLANPKIARDEAMKVLKERAIDGAESETVAGWPILRFRTESGDVRVCVAFVDLPPFREGIDC